MLVTHGPPWCHGDKIPQRFAAYNNGNRYVGDQDLLKLFTSGKCKAKYHLFGHIHDDYSITKQKDLDTVFINASTVNEAYRCQNKPVMFWLPKKDGNNTNQKE